MNEIEVTRYLAMEVMGWKQGIKVVGSHRIDVWKKDGEFIGLYPNANQVDQFDPIHSIEHAWMIVEKLAEKGEFIFIKHDPLRNVHFWTVIIGEPAFGRERITNRADVVDNVPKAICIAAVRATATEQQIAEWL